MLYLISRLLLFLFVIDIFGVNVESFSVSTAFVLGKTNKSMSRSLNRYVDGIHKRPAGVGVCLQASLLQDMITRIQNPVFLLGTSIVGVAAFRIGAFLAVIGQPRMPPLVPTATTTETDNLDESVFTTIGNHVMRLPVLGTRVRVFYPCEDNFETNGSFEVEDSGNSVPYCTDGRATSDGMAAIFGYRQLGMSFLLAHLSVASSGCLSRGTPIPGAPLPLLIYSHGYGGNMDMATYFMRTMASRGMAVAMLEHTDGTASSTVLKDGKRLDFSPFLCSSKQSLRRRADEMIEAVHILPSLLAENLGLEVDPLKVFFGGHSYGATSAILASQASADEGVLVAGLIVHDPTLRMGHDLLDLPPRVPTISYISDEFNRVGVQCGNVTLHVKGAFHGNFLDSPLWAPLWVMRTVSLFIPACGPADPNQVHNELATSAKAFMTEPIPSLATISQANEDNIWAKVVRPNGKDSLFERIS